MKKKYDSEKRTAISNRLAVSYHEMGWMNLAAWLYDFYEGSKDGSELPTEGVKNTKQYLTLLLASEKVNVSLDELTNSLLRLRDKITSEVETVTAYSDRLALFEHLLNRVEYSFREELLEKDNEEEARKLLQFIFSTEDNTVVNMRIRDMVSQLPVRMTKTHFYDLLTNSLSIYEGVEEDTLEGFLYMLTSAAGIPSKTETNTARTDYEELLTFLNSFDYSVLCEEEFSEIKNRMDVVVEQLSVEAECFCTLQKLVNSTLCILMIRSFLTTDSEARATLGPLVMETAQHFLTAMETGDYQEISPAAVDSFSYLEGKLEWLSEQIMKEESAFDDCMSVFDTATSEEQMLQKAKKLMSTSSFVSFEEAKTKLVDKNRVERAKKELVSAMEAAMEGKDRRFTRAIMASVLKELPVFFATHTEVMNYVLASLNGCKDMAEKNCSLDMLWSLYQE